MGEAEDLDREFALAEALFAGEEPAAGESTTMEIVEELTEAVEVEVTPEWVPTVGDEVTFIFTARDRLIGNLATTVGFTNSQYSLSKSVTNGLITSIYGDMLYIESYILESTTLPPTVISSRFHKSAVSFSINHSEEEFISIMMEKRGIVDKALGVIRALRQKTEEEKKILEEKRIAEAKRKAEELKQIKIEEIKVIAEEIHPDSWDFRRVALGDDSSSREDYILIIKFDEVTLTNGRNSTLLTDLYVRFFFDNDLKFKGVMQGNRGTVSYNEMRSNFRHSHLPSNSSGNWDSFCLGQGLMPNEIMSLQADGWNPQQLTKVLLLLYTYVAWESIDGGPHIKMSSINSRSDGSTGSYCPSRADKKMYTEKFNATFDKFPISFDTSGLNKFKVDPLQIEPLLKTIVDQSHCQIKDASCTYTNIVQEPAEKRIRIDRFNRRCRECNGWMFKGERKYVTCTEEIVDVIDADLYVPHREITEEVASSLEKQANLLTLKIQQ